MAPVGRAVVGHDPLDRDALAANQPTARSRNGTALGPALVRQDLAVGQARGIIDADMHGLPAGAPLGVATIAGDPMAEPLDPAELLGVDVDQLARPLALVAHDRRPGLERGQLAEPEAAQKAADRRDRHRQLARDRRAAQALPPQARDLGHARGRHLVATGLGAELRSSSAAAPPAR